MWHAAVLISGAECMIESWEKRVPCSGEGASSRGLFSCAKYKAMLRGQCSGFFLLLSALVVCRSLAHTGSSHTWQVGEASLEWPSRWEDEGH